MPYTQQWLLAAMADLGGEGRRAEVHGRIEDLFGHLLTTGDWKPRVGRRGEPAWKNNIDSLYDRLKKKGVMLPSVQGGPWRLASTGWQAVDSGNLRDLDALGRPHRDEVPPTVGVPVASLPPIEEEDLLANFKPHTGGEYLAQVAGRVLVKRADHDPLLSAYGLAMAGKGWRPRTDVHPRDLEVSRDGEVFLGEVKIVYGGDATRAVREAVAQLLEYRHFFYSAVSPGLLAIFSESVGQALGGLLESLGISAVWRSDDGGWSGSASAMQADLVP